MKGLKKHLLNREIAIKHILEKPASSFTPAAFHKLRVEIKRLNAFFELVEFSLKGFNRNKAIKPFKQIFRQAGKVREIQVEEALLKKYLTSSLLVGYRKDLRLQKSKERTTFYKLINESATGRMRKSIHKTIPMLAEIDKKKVNSYLKEKRNRIFKHLIQYELKPVQIHDLRKLFKSYYYNKDLVVKGVQNPTLDWPAELPELLGRWHDSYVISMKLDQVITSAGIDPEEIIHIQKIMGIISSESETKLRRIKEIVSASYRSDELKL